MAVYQIYFSPTGGTKKVADLLGSAWQEEKRQIDLTEPGAESREYVFLPEDVCIIAVPSFGGRVPGPALERLERMQGNGARAVMTAVYGNREFDDTLLELKDALRGAGFSCAAAVAAVAQHSIFPQFGAGRPDEEDRRELAGFSEKIKGYLESPGGKEEAEVPGKRPFRDYNGVPMKPKAGNGCTKCGVCARECPVRAIPEEAPDTVEESRCISCMHCIAVCPQRARHNSNALLLAGALKLKKSCSGRKRNKIYGTFR